jgi:hypothetical protein
MVGRVSVKTALDGPGRHLQCATTRRGLDRLEVQPVDGARAYERLDLGRDFSGEGFLEAPFFAASGEAAFSWASAHCSQASQ